MSLNDLARYVTMLFVRIFDSKPEKKNKTLASYRWFGLLPLAIRMLIRRPQR